MSKRRRYEPRDETPTKNIFSRRDFVRSGALVATAFRCSSRDAFAAAAGRPAGDEGAAIRLGVASYTFRNFSRAQMIGFLKQLDVLALNAKDVKDHLPKEPQQEGSGAGGVCRGRDQAARRRNHLFPER